MEIIKNRIDILTEQIIELKYLNVIELKTKIRVLFADITYDLLCQTLSGFDKEYSELYRETLITNHGRKHQEILVQLSMLKQKKKQYNKAIQFCTDLKEYEELKQFIKDKFGDEVLKEFFKTL